MSGPSVERIVKCPLCGKALAWGTTPTRPFCSKDCKEKDLGNWATGRYVVPTEEGPEEEKSGEGKSEEGDEG